MSSFGVRAFLRRLFSSEFRLVRLRGPLRGDGPLFSFLYAGFSKNIHELNVAFFNGEAQIANLGRANLPWLPLKLASVLSHEDDILLEECAPWKQLSFGKGIFIQTVTNSKITLNGETVSSYIEKHVSENVSRVLKRARKLGYHAHATSDDDEISSFYHELLVPFVNSRYGKQSLLGDANSLFSLRDVGARIVIIFLEKDGERRAGVALVEDATNSELYVFAYALDTYALNDPKLRADLMALLNAEALAWAEGKFATVSLGLSRPFLNDGVYNYKRQWGCHFERSPNRPVFAVRFLSEKREEFLRLAPLFHLEEDGLAGIMTFAPSSESPKKELESLLKTYAFPGLKNIRVLCGPEIASVMREEIGADYRGTQLEFVSASRPALLYPSR